jgi:uncharacterized membrane protein YhaH (DUF805 family)
MSFGSAITTGFQKYSDFRSGATRSEFWWFNLFLILVSLALGVIGEPLRVLWFLATVVPYFAVGVRRLRDAGFPWGLIFFWPLPLIGTIVLLVLWLQPSKASSVETAE